MTKIECISPLTGEVYATREALSLGEARKAVQRAKMAQKSWKERSIAERSALVLKAVERLKEGQAEATQEMAHMMGRPVHQFHEFSACMDRAAYMASIAEDKLAPIIIEESENFHRRIEKEPVGVVLIIAPWNYPYLTTINTLAPALIAGNTVILKHASQTLLVGERLAQVFHQAGIPEDVFINLALDHDVTSSLISEGHFGFVNFTGSVNGGRAIEKAAAGSFTPIGTELGGKDPAYVMDDADISRAVETLIDGAFFNSGQCCCGIERIYVHESRYEEFLTKAIAATKALKLGNPFDETVTIGPMANMRFAQEVRAQIAEALSEGAMAMIAPEDFPQDDGGVYLAPQILTNVNHTMRVMRDESFGPVVGIMKVKDDAQAVELMNDCEFGLTVSLWTEDYARAAALGRTLETGTVFMNRCDYLDPALCWTGCKNTGHGVALSELGYNSLTKPKSYHLRK